MPDGVVNFCPGSGATFGNAIVEHPKTRFVAFTGSKSVGLEIHERAAHTQDLYTDETRFTALGLDATVVWGHKDVRLRNTTGQSLAFNFEVTTELICSRLWSQQPIDIAEVSIVGEEREGGRQRVSVFREIGGERTLVSSDFYKPADQPADTSTELTGVHREQQG